MKQVLCIVAHADDETLMCGGALARHIEMNHEVTVIIVTDNTKRHGAKGNLNSLYEACHRLSILKENVHAIGLGDQMLDAMPLRAVISHISGKMTNFNIDPDVIYTHSLSDLNRDHRIVTEAILVMYRTVTKDIEIYGGYVGGSTEYGITTFKPDTFINVTGYMYPKLHAFSAYENESQPDLYPRNTSGLKIQAQYFGNQVGVEYAEPFETIKRVVYG